MADPLLKIFPSSSENMPHPDHLFCGSPYLIMKGLFWAEGQALESWKGPEKLSGDESGKT
jgi:hypothetical protein